MIVRAFGIEPVVAINRRREDGPDDAERARESALAAGATAAEICDAFERGGEGAAALARAVASGHRTRLSLAPFRPRVVLS